MKGRKKEKEIDQQQILLTKDQYAFHNFLRV